MDIDFLLTLRTPPCTTAVLLAVVSRGDEAVGVGWVSDCVGWNEKAVRNALKSLVSIDFLVRVHHRGWIASETAVKVIHRLSTGKQEDRLRRYFTASDGKVPPEAVSSAASGTYIYDDDHYIDNGIDKSSVSERLGVHGFIDATRWLKTVNVPLVVMWLDWHEQLSPAHKRRYKRVGGLIRKNVEEGLQPDEIWQQTRLDPLENQIPDYLADVIKK